MAQKSIDWALSIIAGTVALALSWPYWQDHTSPGESVAWWWFYLALGLVLAVHVFRIFLDCLHTLFAHDALDRETTLQQTALPATYGNSTHARADAQAAPGERS
ncbi:MAG: hypothetical protein KUL75_05405 [Sterolibacterium sp.]|nr:hypothetical protein [Sterolibacterium sp.]